MRSVGGNRKFWALDFTETTEFRSDTFSSSLIPSISLLLNSSSYNPNAQTV